MAATGTSVDSLGRVVESFDTAKEEILKALNALTTDGSGWLSELKSIVGGESTDLGLAISQLGGSVMSASDNGYGSLKECYKMIDESYQKNKTALEAAEEQARIANSSVQSISFE